MIIDFSVKNFRSFREEQRISFVASNYDKELPQNLVDPELPGLEGIRLLKALAIYGANAAGKSNVLRALSFLSRFVEESATVQDEGDETGVEPFVLCPSCPDEPSEFALRFIVDGTRYHFALVVDRTRVLFESLSAFPKGVERIWYERSWDEETEQYEWSPKRPTDFKRDANIVGYTRQNALFLSTAVKWNNERLAPVYRWFKLNLQFLRVNTEIPVGMTESTQNYMRRGKYESDKVIRLVRHGDLGILSVKVKTKELGQNSMGVSKEVAAFIDLLEGRSGDVILGHRGEAGVEYPMRWENESAGTQKLFSLAGPWLDILENGYVVGVDEIESSMHTMMVVALLRLIFDEEHNGKGAQFLFTTHNPLLLDPTLLRRDQIWFADKDDEGATHLYPLSDYKPRKGESLTRGYLAGRYGAVPFIPSGLLGKEEPDGE